MQNIFISVTKPKTTPDGNSFKILTCLAAFLPEGYYYQPDSPRKKRKKNQWNMKVIYMISDDWKQMKTAEISD